MKPSNQPTGAPPTGGGTGKKDPTAEDFGIYLALEQRRVAALERIVNLIEDAMTPSVDAVQYARAVALLKRFGGLTAIIGPMRGLANELHTFQTQKGEWTLRRSDCEAVDAFLQEIELKGPQSA